MLELTCVLGAVVLLVLVVECAIARECLGNEVDDQQAVADITP